MRAKMIFVRRKKDNYTEKVSMQFHNFTTITS